MNVSSRTLVLFSILLAVLCVVILLFVRYGPSGLLLTPSQGGQGIAAYTSGVRGEVLLGPTCPVMRNPPDPACADKPYATLVSIYRGSDTTHVFASTRSDEAGNFEASLPPGEYVIGAGESMLPRCAQVSVTVSPDGVATTTISCDTGIR